MRQKRRSQLESVPTAQADGVTGWRREQLERAGFDSRLAQPLAASTVDLHALIGLVEHGCPPRLAARIMAPL